MNIPVLALDIGTSCSKWGIRLPDGRLLTGTLASLGILGGQNAFPGPHLSVLAQPVKGAYDARSIESGAKYVRQGDIYEQDIYRLILFGALSNALDAANIQDEQVAIQIGVFGFPWSHLSQGQVLVDLLQGKTWTVQKVDGKAYQVIFERIVYESQPYFAVVDQMCAWKSGSLSFARAESLFANGPAIVLHGGSNSWDFAHIPSTLLNAHYGSLALGVFQIEEQIIQEVYAQTHVNISGEEAMEVFRTGRFWFKSQEYDFNAVLQHIAEVYFDAEIVTPFQRFYTKHHDAATLLLVGGGVIRLENVLKDKFSAYFRRGVQMCVNDAGQPEPVLSILSGMLKKGFLEYVKGQDVRV